MTFLGLLVHGLALAVVASGIAKLVDDSVATAAIRAAELPVLTEQHRPGRIVGAAEVLIGMATIAVPIVVGPAALTGLYAAFAWFVVRLRHRDPDASCGCIGSTETPPGLLHLMVSLIACVIGLAGVIYGVPDVTDAVGGDLPGLIVYVGTTFSVALMTVYIPVLAHPAVRDGY